MTAAAPADVALPGLAVLDDAAALAALLEERGETLLRCRYRRWKPGTSTVLALELASGPAWALAVCGEARAKLAKTVERAPRGAVLLDRRDLGLLVARPAADRDLPALADLDAALARALPDGADGGGRRWRGLACKPQRRWVGVLEGPTPQTVRAYRRADLAAARAGLAAAASAGVLPVPHEAAAVPRAGLLLTSWLPGRPLDTLLGTPSADALLAAAGEALARLHAGTRPAAVAAPADGDLAAVAGQLVALLPDEGPRVHRLARRLEVRPAAAEPAVLRHGDFSADQVVVDDDGRVGVVDWDRAGPGRAVDDLATADAAGLTAAQHAALRTGYARVRPLPAGLPGAVARARLLRAAEPFRRCSPTWADEVRARLDAVEEVLR